MRRRLKTGLGILALLCAALVARAVPVEVDPPMTVALTVVEHPRNVRVLGDLVGYDEVGATLLVDGERQRFEWSTLTPTSAFTARHRLVDEADAASWLSLARFGRLVGAERQSEYAIGKAIKLDSSLEGAAAAVRELPLGELRQPGLADGATTVDPEEQPDEGPTGLELPPTRWGGRPVQLPPKFLPVQQDHARQAEQLARERAQADLTNIGVRMRLVETPHFLIFTDWDPVDDRWLAEQLEGCYALLAREFDVPADQPVFLGRLPVYMFHAHEAMLAHARANDDFAEVSDGVAGYFASSNTGLGQLVMSKPRATREVGLELARKQWSRTLAHEFVHAFLARYRGNGFLPRWLNEGLAEMLAETIHPRPNAMEIALAVAREGGSIATIFDDAQYPGATYYPVMMTLTQALYREDPAKFVHMVDRIKAGEAAEAVLREMYGVDYAGLELAWRAFMLR